MEDESPTQITIDFTSSDWEPTEATKFFAQRQTGAYAFGPTEQEALTALLELESK
jgi:hypothetical protein